MYTHIYIYMYIIRISVYMYAQYIDICIDSRVCLHVYTRICIWKLPPSFEKEALLQEARVEPHVEPRLFLGGHALHRALSVLGLLGHDSPHHGRSF